MPRAREILLLVAVGAIFAVGAARLSFIPYGSRATVAEAPSQRWCRLSQTDRGAYTRLFQSVAERPDGSEVFRRVRRFAALPAGDQARLRALWDAVERALADQPGVTRRALWSLQQRARAEALYRLLETEAPDVLRAARERARASP